MLLYLSGLVSLCVATVPPTTSSEPAADPRGPWPPSEMTGAPRSVEPESETWVTTTEEPEPQTWAATLRSLPSLLTWSPAYERRGNLLGKRNFPDYGPKSIRKVPVDKRTRPAGRFVMPDDELWDDIRTAINVEPSLDNFIRALHSLVRTLYGASRAEMLSVLTFDQLSSWERMRDELIPSSCRGASTSSTLGSSSAHVVFVRSLLGVGSGSIDPIEILRDETQVGGGDREDRDVVVVNALKAGPVSADDIKKVYSTELYRIMSRYLERIRNLTTAVSTSPRHMILFNRPIDPSVGPFESMWLILRSGYFNLANSDLAMFASQFPQWAHHLGHLTDDELGSTFHVPTNALNILGGGGRNAPMNFEMTQYVNQVDALMEQRREDGSDSLDDLIGDSLQLQEAAYIVLLSDIKSALSTWSEELIRGRRQ